VNFYINWVSKGLVELHVETHSFKVNSGMLNAKEAKELARDLLSISEELLQVEEK